MAAVENFQSLSKENTNDVDNDKFLLEKYILKILADIYLK